MNSLEKFLNQNYKVLISLIEKFLAFVILSAIIIFIIHRTLTADISQAYSVQFIQQLISDVLLMLLGLEVVRLLIVPSVQAALELLIFVVARKTLTPDITSTDLILDIVAFAILIIINRTCIPKNISQTVKKIVRKVSL